MTVPGDCWGGGEEMVELTIEEHGGRRSTKIDTRTSTGGAGAGPGLSLGHRPPQ